MRAACSTFHFKLFVGDVPGGTVWFSREIETMGGNLQEAVHHFFLGSGKNDNGNDTRFPGHLQARETGGFFVRVWLLSLFFTFYFPSAIALCWFC